MNKPTLTIGIAALALVLATSAQAEPIMCKNPKTYFCTVDGCVPTHSLRSEDVIILDLAEKELTACKGRSGECTKTKLIIQAGREGYFISGPAMTLQLIDNELTLALSNTRKIMTQFFQCAKP